jgi:hypothetical protein
LETYYLIGLFLGQLNDAVPRTSADAVVARPITSS